MKICIIDYGTGNIKAFKNIYDKLNVDVEIASRKDQLVNATHLILPGVGAFDWAISRLNESGLRQTLDMLVLEKKVPILGVCVGMQIMASESEEGVLSGLKWIEGKVLKFNKKIILPHMGWNSIKPLIKSNLFSNIENHEFYFLHSYYYKTKYLIEEVGLDIDDLIVCIDISDIQNELVYQDFEPSEKGAEWKPGYRLKKFLKNNSI
ncbi:MAG: imidazole glycerol phosphate synthase subunit HisH, partial [Lutibacter sp.]|nr:imidazole glycerol phosphate synthase subunit HisH [Lutibacter sp.]